LRQVTLIGDDAHGDQQLSTETGRISERALGAVAPALATICAGAAVGPAMPRVRVAHAGRASRAITRRDARGIHRTTSGAHAARARLGAFGAHAARVAWRARIGRFGSRVHGGACLGQRSVCARVRHRCVDRGIRPWAPGVFGARRWIIGATAGLGAAQCALHSSVPSAGGVARRTGVVDVLVRRRAVEGRAAVPRARVDSRIAAVILAAATQRQKREQTRTHWKCQSKSHDSKHARGAWPSTG
jgi:hypothetical protein